MKNFTAVDIFSGAGGLSIGAEMSGIKTILAVEYDKHAADSFKRNHKDTNVLNEDIRNVKPLEHVNKNPFIYLEDHLVKVFQSLIQKQEI